MKLLKTWGMLAATVISLATPAAFAAEALKVVVPTAPGGGTVGAAMQTRGWTQLMIGIAAAIQGRGGSARPNSFHMWNTAP